MKNISLFPLRQFSQTILSVGLFAFFTIFSATADAGHETNKNDLISQVQERITGEWTAKIDSDKPNKINLQFIRRTEGKGHMNMSGHDIEFSELQGLSRDQAMSENATNVTFRLSREAGSVDFEGSFRGGRGAGSFTLSPNDSFFESLRNRGYLVTGENKMLTAVVLNLTSKFVNDFESMGFPKGDMDELFKALIFKVTPEFASEMRAAGFEKLDLEDLVKARIFKVDAAFASEVQNMGFGRQSMESLVEMRIFKVTPEFLREMKGAGLANLTVKDLVKLRIFKIDGEFIQQARAQGHNVSDMEELVQLKIFKKVK